MFIGTDVRLGLSFNAAQVRLAHLTRGGLLRHASDDAYQDLRSGMARVGPLGAMPGVSKLVAVRFGDMTVHQNFAVMALRWEATGPGGALFPALDADIMLTRTGDDATVLEISGVYRPPGGGLGAGLDRVVLRRVAQGTIRTFARRIAAAIADPAISPDDLLLDHPPEAGYEGR